MSNTNPARGMRDFLPDQVRKRDYVIGIIREVYEKYGFEPLETPAVENLDTLTNKYGEEGDQLMYKILKRGEKLQNELEAGNIKSENDLSDLALRYDLTVPLARVVANYKNDLPKFFKRYQIQPVWRADRPARGRFREFYQCDADAIGSKSMVVEAELISAVSEILGRLGFEDFLIRVNHRKLLSGLLESADIPAEKHQDAIVALDKIDKIGREGVLRELGNRYISDEASLKLMNFLNIFITNKFDEVFSVSNKQKIVALQRIVEQYEKGFQSAANLKDSHPETKEQITKFSIELKSLSELSNRITENAELLKKSFLANPSEEIQVSRDSFWDDIAGSVGNIEITSPFHYNLAILLEILKFVLESPKGNEGAFELLDLIGKTGPSSNISSIKIDPFLARGLSYYTGAIFEITIPDFTGSIAGGGRYDGLIGMFGKEEIPAVGISLGLERILMIMEERGEFDKLIKEGKIRIDSADVMVTIWNEETVSESLKLAGELRAQGLRVLVYPEADKLGKQFKYADQINARYVCILGETELADNTVSLKNMKTGDQETVARDKAADGIKTGASSRPG